MNLPDLSDRDTSGEFVVPGRRSNAARLLHRLKEINARARIDANYLFTKDARLNMMPTPSGNAAVPEIVEHSSEPGVVKRLATRGESFSPQLSHSSDATRIPVGLPRLPIRAGDDAHVAILTAWLKDCDKHKSRVREAPAFLPKRLLHVAFVDSSKVVETAAWSSNETFPYLALSHPWGKGSPTNRHFKSDRDNIKDRMRKTKDRDLPLNFRHAKIDTDPGDFHEESKWMEKIYASAYCVIAASSAEHMSSGFLGHERDKAAVQLYKGDKSTQHATFLCEAIDDFQGELLNGPLSKRGWVLQERALARRTIFFTNNHTYWECSQRIRCETLSKLTKQGWPGVPLPTAIRRLHPTGIVAADRQGNRYLRPGAAPTRVIGGSSGAGIFSKHWGRCLLWKRDDSGDSKTAGLKRIPAPPNTKAPPSWSWMAYEGGMSYLYPPEARTSWNEKSVELQLTGTADTSWLYAETTLKLSAPLMGFDDQEKTKDGSLQDKDQAEKGLHFILVVKPATTHGGSDTWERIGAGKLHGRFIQDMKAITNTVEIT
ncbi:uncharacterized protein RAG0_00793 [Rhynchosporium agropyri]|uniref:Heterokaryon incompatibility domain-containing protein n=1 Tax=Rhynchosporium agropyri TaxID=914238 RepID=A0A1E1JU91_9HELO|nr:uncharacterized protein RAG0_00793 [Rhynchosporium agropyri]